MQFFILFNNFFIILFYILLGNIFNNFLSILLTQLIKKNVNSHRTHKEKSHIGSAETSLYGVWLYADLFDRAKYQPIYFSISQGVTTAILVYWIDTLVFFSVFSFLWILMPLSLKRQVVSRLDICAFT